MPKYEIIPTKDGSHTIHQLDWDVTFHSKWGAIQETDHVFIQNGLHYLAQSLQKISIFEMGFGSGLNVVKALSYAAKHHLTLSIESIDAYPLGSELIDELNYDQFLSNSELSYFQKIHKCEWNSKCVVNQRNSFIKISTSFFDYQPTRTFELIFYDAFGPTTQPELWSLEATDKLYGLLKIGGVLVTYCAQGQFKRNLISSGFTLNSLPGPPGKREMVRAIRE